MQIAMARSIDVNFFLDGSPSSVDDEHSRKGFLGSRSVGAKVLIGEANFMPVLLNKITWKSLIIRSEDNCPLIRFNCWWEVEGSHPSEGADLSCVSRYSYAP